jgi:putative transposase
MRKIKFEIEEYYHIFNRGVDKREIFMNEKDYIRFLKNMREFNNNSTKEERNKKELSSGYPELSSWIAKLPKQVNIIAYCLNPNHFHFLLKQIIETGVENFMHKMGTGFTNYTNKKLKRSGSLFQGPYQAVKIETNEQLLFVSAYINGNAEIHNIAKANAWQWSSCLDYLDMREGTLCNKNLILKQFEDINEYRKYLIAVINGCKERKSDFKKFELE